MTYDPSDEVSIDPNDIYSFETGLSLSFNFETLDTTSSDQIDRWLTEIFDQLEDVIEECIGEKNGYIETNGYELNDVHIYCDI